VVQHCRFFNIPEASHLEHLRRIKEAAATKSIADGLQHTEDYKIRIHAHLEKPSVIKAEHVNIRRLDPKNITIVSTVMAQTVALDYYQNQCDRMLESFMHMNMKIEATGSFDPALNDGLYKLIVSNDTVITNVIYKVSGARECLYMVHVAFIPPPAFYASQQRLRGSVT